MRVTAVFVEAGKYRVCRDGKPVGVTLRCDYWGSNDPFAARWWLDPDDLDYRDRRGSGYGSIKAALDALRRRYREEEAQEREWAAMLKDAPWLAEMS